MSRAMIVRSLVLKAAMPWALLMMAACTAGSMSGGGTGWSSVGPSGTAAGGQTSLETQQACRQRTSEIYEKRERPQIYAANSSLNSPFSANYQPDVPSRGLSDQFAYERTNAECERNAGAGTGQAASQPASPTH
jgi:hypothetical protein